MSENHINSTSNVILIGLLCVCVIGFQLYILIQSVQEIIDDFTLNKQIIILVSKDDTRLSSRVIKKPILHYVNDDWL